MNGQLPMPPDGNSRAASFSTVDDPNAVIGEVLRGEWSRCIESLYVMLIVTFVGVPLAAHLLFLHPAWLLATVPLVVAAEWVLIKLFVRRFDA